MPAFWRRNNAPRSSSTPVRRRWSGHWSKRKKAPCSGNMPTKKRVLRSHQTLNLVLPATSANLGPGFDAAALALGLFLKVHAETADKFSVTATGRDPHICGRLEDH